MVLDLLMRMRAQLLVIFHQKDGATAIEYLILVAIVALVVLAAGATLGPQITTFIAKITTAIT